MALFPQGLHAFLHAPQGDVLRGGGGIAVGQAAFHGKGVPDGDGPLRGHYLHVPVGLAHIFPAGLPLGEIIPHGVGEQELSPLIEHHHGGVERDFGHGCLAEEGSFGHRGPGVPVRHPEVPLVEGLAPLHDLQGAAGQSPLHKAFQKPVDVFCCCHVFYLLSRFPVRLPGQMPAGNLICILCI